MIGYFYDTPKMGVIDWGNVGEDLKSIGTAAGSVYSAFQQPKTTSTQPLQPLPPPPPQSPTSNTMRNVLIVGGIGAGALLVAWILGREKKKK